MPQQPPEQGECEVPVPGTAQGACDAGLQAEWGLLHQLCGEWVTAAVKVNIPDPLVN